MDEGPCTRGLLAGFLQALRSLRLRARRGGGGSAAVWWGAWGQPAHGARMSAHLSGLTHPRVPRCGRRAPACPRASVCRCTGWHVRGASAHVAPTAWAPAEAPAAPGSAPNEFSAALHIKQPHEKVFFSPIFIQCAKHAAPAPHPCKRLVHSCSFKRTKGEGGGRLRGAAQSQGVCWGSLPSPSSVREELRPPGHNPSSAPPGCPWPAVLLGPACPQLPRKVM